MDLISREAAIQAIRRALRASDDLMSRIICEGIENVLAEVPTIQSDLTEEDKRLLKKLRSFHSGSYAIVLDKLTAAATARPEPRTGAWVPTKRGEKGYSAGDFRCSICGKPNACWTLTNYCAKCGAKMK